MMQALSQMHASHMLLLTLFRERRRRSGGGRGGDRKRGWRGRKRRKMEVCSFPAHHCPSLHMLAQTLPVAIILPFAALILV